ncbi:hypothetical protein V4U86_24755 [Mycobacterium sp. AMU20-3851]|uniref:hypothetical protein n=1 Tax=Mycobacterium sp. AMU20-3851 TaxID=3122055 RepID=UPI0037548B1D
MKMTVAGLIVGALAVGTLVGAGAAQAAPFEYIDNPSPHVNPIKDATGKIIGWQDTNPTLWDFTGDVIKLPGGGSIRFTGKNDWERNYKGRTGPKSAGNPSE